MGRHGASGAAARGGHPVRVLHLTSSFPRHAGDHHGPYLGELVAAQQAAGMEPMVVAPHARGLECDDRRAMAAHELNEIPLYPEGRGCPAPSAPRIFAIFNGVARQHLVDADGALVQTFAPELTQLQLTVLDLLGIPASSYQ